MNKMFADLSLKMRQYVFPPYYLSKVDGIEVISGTIKTEEIGSSLFTMGSILDYKVLLESLGARKHPHKQQIWKFLNQKCKDKIKNLSADKPIDESLKESIIAGFNEILNSEDFYDPDVFKDIKLTAGGKSLYQKGLEKLEKSDLHRFNRLLFESIYPHEIAKSQEIFCYDPLDCEFDEINKLYSSIADLKFFDEEIKPNRRYRIRDKIDNGSFKINQKLLYSVIRFCNKYGLPGGVEIYNIVIDEKGGIQNIKETNHKLIEERNIFNDKLWDISPKKDKKTLNVQDNIKSLIKKPGGHIKKFVYQPLKEILLDLFDLQKLIYIYQKEISIDMNDVHCYFINNFLKDVNLTIYPDISKKRSSKQKKRLEFIPLIEVKNLKQAIAFMIFLNSLNPSIGWCQGCGDMFIIDGKGTKTHCDPKCSELKRANNYYNNHRDEIARKRRARREAKKYLQRWPSEVNNIPRLRKIWRKYSANIDPFTLTVLPPLTIRGLILFQTIKGGLKNEVVQTQKK